MGYFGKLLAIAGAFAAALVQPAAMAHSDLNPSASESAQLSSSPVQLVEFNFEKFFIRAVRLGMLTQTLGNNVTVAADGEVTDCALSRSFRRSFTAQELCKAIARYARFEPARNERGDAIDGTYAGELQINSYFAPSQ